MRWIQHCENPCKINGLRMFPLVKPQKIMRGFRGYTFLINELRAELLNTVFLNNSMLRCGDNLRQYPTRITSQTDNSGHRKRRTGPVENG